MTTTPGFTPLVIERIDDTWWKLAEDLVYTGSRDDTHVVPMASQTDFASVPWFLQSLIPSTGKWTLAAVVHDHLCDDLNRYYAAQQAPYAPIGKLTNRERSDLLDEAVSLRAPAINAVDTDGIFRQAMELSGVDPVRRWAMWAAVRWGALANPARREGWFRWDQLWRVIAISLAALVAGLAVLLIVHLGVGALIGLFS